MARGGTAKAAQVKPRGSRVYDLRKFAPEPLGFTADDNVTYWISADPSVDLMAELLILDNVLRGNVDAIDDLDVDGMSDEDVEAELGLRIARAAIRAKEIIVQLAREYDPDVTDIPLKGGQLLQLLAFIGGGETVAEGLAKDLTAAMTQLTAEEQASLYEHAQAAGDDDGDEESLPLGSEKPSSRRSRSSTGTRATGRTAGLPAGG